jgi:hypothetical protein
MLIIPMPPFSQLCNNDIDSILKTRIFCNSSITFKNKPLGFTLFLQSNLRTINDIWDSNNGLSLIFKVTLRSGTIVVSPFKTFMNFSGISFFILENSEIQFLLSINKLYIS